MKMTQEQQEILASYRTSSKDLVINAFAGTGKTTTLRLIAEQNPKDRFLYLAFNRKIVKEAKETFPPNVAVKTAHALAYQGLKIFDCPEKLKRARFKFENLLLDLNTDVSGITLKNLSELMRDMIRIFEHSSRTEIDPLWVEKWVKPIIYGCSILEHVSHQILASRAESLEKRIEEADIGLAKSYVYGFLETVKKIQDGDKRHKLYATVSALDVDFLGILMKEFELSEALAARLEHFIDDFQGAIKRFWQEYSRIDNDIPFEHSTYLKVFQLSKPKLKSWDTILFDECQDANPVILDIVNRQSVRKVWVGDRHQAIYQFTGAINSFDRIIDKSCHQHQLTKSFRFGNDIAAKANKVLKLKKKFQNIRYPIPAIKGLNNPLKAIRGASKNAHLCRTNAGVIETALDIMKGAADESIYVGDCINEKILSDLCDVYWLWIHREERNKIKSTYIKSFEDIKELLVESHLKGDAEMIRLYNLVKKMMTFDEPFLLTLSKLRKVVRKQDKNAKNCVITAHKAKGLEWDHVILGEDFVGFFFDEDGDLKPFIRESELNLLYVGVTRARRDLTLQKPFEHLIS